MQASIHEKVTVGNPVCSLTRVFSVGKPNRKFAVWLYMSTAAHCAPQQQLAVHCSVCYVQGAVVANYPWDGLTDPNNSYSASPDDATFRYLAKVYADAHTDMHNSKEFPEGITNGAHWYPISGGMQVKLVVRGRVEERGGGGRV